MATWPGPSEERPSTKHVYCSRIELQLSSATIVCSCEEEEKECYKLRTTITVILLHTCKCRKDGSYLRLHIIEEKILHEKYMYHLGHKKCTTNIINLTIIVNNLTIINVI